jgi:hypothetical protein
MDSPPQTHDQEDQAPEPVSGSPSDFLKNIVGKKVKVRIGSGVDYHGTSLSLSLSLLPFISFVLSFTQVITSHVLLLYAQHENLDSS